MGCTQISIGNCSAYGPFNEHTYLKPGKTKKDKRGVDFFVDEKELMGYLDRVDLEEMKKQAVKPSETTTTVERADGQEKEAVTRDRGAQAYIVFTRFDSNTFVSYTNPGTVSANPGAVPGGGGLVAAPRVDVASEINDESSNGGMDAASSHASEKNSEQLIATSPHVRVERFSGGSDEDNDETSRRNLASAFDDGGLSDRGECFVNDGNGSMGSASDAEVEETKDDDATIALGTLMIRPQHCEDVTGYAALDSGGESEGTSIIDEDEDLGAGEADYMVEDGGISSDVQFEPSLVEAVGGLGAINRGSVHADILKDMDGAFQTIVLRFHTWGSHKRAAAQHAREQDRRRQDTDFVVQSPDRIKARLLAAPDISGREFCVFIGLLIARTISPNKEKFENHWRTTDEGAIPRGCFNPFLTRDRFAHLSRNMHFSRNDDAHATTDRAWKLRPVITTLQQTFQSNFIPQPVMAFDASIEVFIQPHACLHEG
ncbi:hypothetical protein ON010_g5822 [Phytophthora cinnamomi]|nr:hypothetical protein ON010_g5822 [Phytophthora cinnamomi]